MSEDSFKVIYDHFTYAESKIKKIERLNGDGISIPSINQLRYAGQHVLTAILAEDSEVRKNNVYEAIDHCKRATYDAFEIGILHFLSEINTFKQDYKYITVTDIIPDYVDKLKKVREAQSFIEVNNRNSINDKSFEMDGRYSEIEVHYNNLEGINHSFDVAREELSKKIVSLRRNLILTILGLIFVIISWIITILVSK